MQYYIYNNLNSQNEYQKVFVDGILAADREISIGKELFEIFTTFSSEPPIGSLPLNGYEITECSSKLPEFWSLCVRRKENGTIPCVSDLDTYNQILSTQNGNCGYFYIQDNNDTVKLPCINPAHINIYYWIQVFSSYITQDSNGKLLVISNNNTSGYIVSLLPTISSSIAALISANILNNLRELLRLVPLTFTAIDSDVEITLTDNTNLNVLYYRRDSSASWQLYDGTSIKLEKLGDYVQFQNINEEWLNTYKDGLNTGGLFKLIENSSNKKYKASGNIQSLLNYIDNTIPRCYAHMFHDCSSLTEAPELPATTLVNRCYYSMFANCSGLTKAPELPVKTLANLCYAHMFAACASLTEAPELPATTLAAQCYYNMFSECYSLTEAPELSATILADSCYLFMFRDCSSLTEAPELPATILADSCYLYMFNGCTKLASISVKFTSWDDIYTSNWTAGVSLTGTFICPAVLPELVGVSRIPAGWTVQTI